MSPPSLLKRHKQYLGPSFVIFETMMHIYLAIYLTLNWTNWPIWLFTIFELVMFIYLLLNRDKGNGHYV